MLNKEYVKLHEDESLNNPIVREYMLLHSYVDYYKMHLERAKEELEQWLNGRVE